MAYVYRHFIPQNIAPPDAKSIGVYDASGKRITSIPLGRLKPPTKEKLYSFGLVSDMHLWKSGLEWNPDVKFDSALSYFESQGCVFCAHCGDITQTGFYYEGDAVNINYVQFAEYKRWCDAHPNLPVYGICGNHESYVNPVSNNLTDLKTYTGTDLYYTVERGNDLFIFIGQPSATVVMSTEAYTWLTQTLSANTHRRCFVFVHAYIEEDSGDPCDVRENSIFDHWGATNTNAFMNLLSQYDNVVLFHGHSHMKFQCQELDECANYTEKNGFKSVHVPSLGIPRDVDTVNKVSVDDRTASQGYVVDVYDDCIVLNGWDFIGNKPVPLGTFKIDT